MNLQRRRKVLTFGWSREGESGSYVVCGWVGRLSEVAMEKRLKGDISLLFLSSAAHDVRKKSHASGETQKPGPLFPLSALLSFSTSIHFESLLLNREWEIEARSEIRLRPYIPNQSPIGSSARGSQILNISASGWKRSFYPSDKVRVIRSKRWSIFEGQKHDKRSANLQETISQ